MKRLLICLIITSLVLTTAVFAQSLSIETNKASYVEEETISVTSIITSEGTITNPSVSINILKDGVSIATPYVYYDGTQYTSNYYVTSAGTYTIEADAIWNEANASNSTTVEVRERSMEVTITNVDETYYGGEEYKPKFTIKDQYGNYIENARVYGTVEKDGVEQFKMYFSHSVLCNCYEGYRWLEDSFLGEYTLRLAVEKYGYPDVIEEYTFNVVKPGLNVELTTSESSYQSGEEVKFIVTVTDDAGEIADYASVFGELKDQDGNLITDTYLWKHGDDYMWEYWVQSEYVGQTLTFSVEVEYKEQTATEEVSITITELVFSVDILLDDNELEVGEYISGNIKIMDSDGNIITNAWPMIRIYDPDGDRLYYMNAFYEDGYHVIERKKIEEWMVSGTYTIEARVQRGTDTITVSKTFTVEKDTPSLEVEMDKEIYSPGGKIFLKMLVKDPDGNIIEDAIITGEVFPLSNDTRQIESWGDQPQVCERSHLYPELPIYYNEIFYQEYYLDEIQISPWCPESTYVINIDVDVKTYETVSFTKEFQVILPKLELETAIKVESGINNARIVFFVETKEESDIFSKELNIEAEIKHKETGECQKHVPIHLEPYGDKYIGDITVLRYECPEGEYVLNLKTHSSYYDTTTLEQTFELKYEEGYEYKGIRAGENCTEVSCGENCIQKICPIPEPVEECRTLFDKECIASCRENVSEDEIQSCVDSCEYEQCGTVYSSDEEMMNKLDEIHEEIKETRKEVTTLRELINNLIDFLKNMFG